MNKLAVQKAGTRLIKMRRAVETIRLNETPQFVEDGWGDFVLAASSFYNVLLQGAKANPASKRWFDHRKHERRTDPLLRYLHQARNADEHGIAKITGRSNSKIVLKSQDAYATLRCDGKKWIVVDQDGEIEFPNDTPILVRVHDERFGDWFEPPEQHLGQEIRGRSPLVAAELALTYFEVMLAEAAVLPD